MQIEQLQKERIAAMKAKDKPRKDAISSLVSAVKKTAIDEGCRDDIKEELVNRVILKEMKTVKEQIDSCPAERTDLLAEYQQRYDIMSEYAPAMLSEEEVRKILTEKFADVIATKNKGQIMKTVMPELKGKADGKLIGHMTDGEGFVGNLRDHGIEIKGKKITVAGGGGAATAIQVQCALDGAREISIFNIKDDFFERTLETAEKIRKEVPGIVVNVYDIADTAKMTEEIQSSDIFANATIVGMKPMEKESVVKDTSAFRPGLVVADAVYNPEETRLLREAKEAGCTCLNGKGMLLWQGVAAFRLYTGEEMPVREVKEKFFQ